MTAKSEAELRSRVSPWREAEQPIVDDLGSVGVEVASVWDLVNTMEPYAAALPILIDHLERGGYPDRVMEGLGRALGVSPAVEFWGRLKAVCVAARTTGEEEGAAVASAACATEAQLDDLIDFLSVEERGQSRVFFLGAIERFGGERGRTVLEQLAGEAIFGPVASAIVGRDQ
jgi:hypothetical protein